VGGPRGVKLLLPHLNHSLHVYCMYRSVTLALSRCILALRFAMDTNMDPKIWPLFAIWRTSPIWGLCYIVPLHQTLDGGGGAGGDT
jgi:hypothetical protein